MVEIPSVLNFKFHWLNDQGQQASVFRKKGQFDGETLTLEETSIPTLMILDSIVRDNRMVLTLFTGDDKSPISNLLIQPSSKKIAEVLKKHIDLARSKGWAKQHQQDIEEKGLGHTYRDAQCPVCTATLVLTDMPVSPQLYCHYCESLTTVENYDDPVRNEADFKICEECGMYAKPRKFTVFYFYFLIVFYGWWSKPTWRCPACMRGEAWKMFFGNLVFLLGVPVAIIQLVRSYTGDGVSGSFKGLDTGNIKARKGNLAGALENYRTILDRVPYSAGIKYNLGLALLEQGDHDRAATTFELALEDCSNYTPAYHQLLELYPLLGEIEKLQDLQRVWRAGEEADEEEVELIP